MMKDDDFDPFKGGGHPAPISRDGPHLTGPLTLVLAITCGASVANIYYAQPLLDAMAATFGLSNAAIGLVVTLTQIGYAAGLVFIVPIADMVDRRKLVIGQTIFSVLALVFVAIAPAPLMLFGGMVAVGLVAVVVQVLVALSAALAPPEQSGQAVGRVTSGVVIGILAARFVAGALADIAGWRAVYLASAGLMAIMSVLLIRVLPRRMPVGKREPYARVLKSIPLLFVHEKVLRVRAMLAFLIFASFSTLWTAMVLPLESLPYAMSHTAIGLFGLAGLAGALAASGAGRWVDRGFGQRTTGISLVLLALSWGAISLLPVSLAAFSLGVIALDFAVQAVHVTNQSMIFAVRPEARSRLVGGYMVFYSTGSALGAIASTVVYAHFGWTGVSMLGFSLSVIAFMIWALAARSG